MFAAALFKLTGGILRYIDGTPRRDTQEERFEVISEDLVNDIVKDPSKYFNY
jgi:hypothetical protein